MTTLMIGVTVVSIGPESWADTVTLKRAIRAPMNQDVIRLADVAELDGVSVERLANLPVATNPKTGAFFELRLETVREKLTDAGIKWATTHLSGGDVVIRPRRPVSDGQPLPMTPVGIGKTQHVVERPAQPRTHTVNASSLVDEATVRGEIARMTLAALKVEPSDLQLQFAADDSTALDSPTAGYRIEIDPQSAFTTDRMTVDVRFWSDDRVEKRITVSYQPTIRVQLPVLTRDVSRHTALLASDVTTQEKWVSPQEARQYPTIGDVPGKRAARTMRAGAALRERDIEARDVIQRGDQVTVRCVSGRLVVTVAAEAMEDGPLGSMIDLRKLGERSVFQARITGPGEAVVQLGTHGPSTHH